MKTEAMRENCVYVSGLMKAISHPQRLMILCYLSEGEKNVSELLEVCDVSQSQLSQFLIRMNKEGLLDLRKEGQFSYYRIADKNMIKLIQSMQKIFCA